MMRDVLAVVDAKNAASLKVVQALGMGQVSGPPGTNWTIPLARFKPPLLDRLWLVPDWERFPAFLGKFYRSLYNIVECRNHGV